MKRYWRIRGYDSLQNIFDKTVPLGYFTENQIEQLLQALTAKASLNFEEIVGAYARRRTRVSNSLLEVRRDWKHSSFMCGTNPHFMASVVDEHGKIIVYDDA